MSQNLIWLEQICREIFDRWDADQRSGKLLKALAGEIPDYDPRITAIRKALSEKTNG
jgi:hypothetical protein